MTQKRTTADSRGDQSGIAIRIVLITLDNHLSDALARAAERFKQQVPGLHLAFHAATDWDNDPGALQLCKQDIAEGDIVVATMLFMEPHINAVLEDLMARRDRCDAMICCMSAGEVMKLTRMGRFSMGEKQGGAMALLKRLRGKQSGKKSMGAQQLSVLKRLPRILKFIPGTAQDVRIYFLLLQYWLAGSEENLVQMMQMLVQRYASGPRAVLRTLPEAKPPIDYPETGLYHPDLPNRITAEPLSLPAVQSKTPRQAAVGLLVMRSYALAGNTQHYDAVIRGLEKRGLRVIPAFASGLDARPAVDRFFVEDGVAQVDAVVSLTGFSLVGGPAYNDNEAAQALLAELDVPYLSVQALEFQSLESWSASKLGLMPIEATMMVSIPELDGATGPMIFGGRSEQSGSHHNGMVPHAERIDRLADRVQKLVHLRRSQRAERKVAVVLFNFPPNAGSTGTAAHLSVFASLHNTLQQLQSDGYHVELPASVDALRDAVLKGNAEQLGMDANVVARISVDDYVQRETWLEEIESQWGPAPGRQLTNGRELFILGAEFGNVLVSVQPPMGYEGDPMRLLFEGGHAPTHAFSAFYRYLREDWAADAVLHFGTHGAMEFMPGKQIGLSAECWPDRLIGALPNFYLYAANNPSEGLIAKRRSAATLVSYLTPPVVNVDLYRELKALRESIDHWRERSASLEEQGCSELLSLIKQQAVACDLRTETDADLQPSDIDGLRFELDEIEDTMIPFGLHVIGQTMTLNERVELLKAISKANASSVIAEPIIELIVNGADVATLLQTRPDLCEREDQWLQDVERLISLAGQLTEDTELAAISRALDGRYIPPVTGGDLLRTPEILPTGRNIHGFDPFRLPSAFAVREGARQATHLLERHCQNGEPTPRSIALVLWGTDNLKSEGIGISQALALLGARPRLDSYGRVAGAELIPLEELGRPRIDVIVTLSGIFRDLLPLQTRLLAEAAYLAASAEESEALNPIRANTLAYQAEHGCDFDTAALRVFSNAEGAYGSNVNMLIDSGAWEDESELADTFTSRKGHAYSHNGNVSTSASLLSDMLSGVDLAYQNLDSVEIGVTSVDHYFDTLGGISRAINRKRGDDVPVYIADYTGGAEKVRTLAEQVALETRTRVLNPQWYESMLEHGYEGVRAIETHVTNTMGWSATTGQVAPWVYQQLSETFILDAAMRERLAKLNPKAAAKVAHRLLEAHERDYWKPDEDCLDALRQAGDDLDDWIEGIRPEAVA